VDFELTDLQTELADGMRRLCAGQLTLDHLRTFESADKVVDRKHTRKEAEAYLAWLYSDEGQEIAARHGLRPRSEKILAAHAREFPKVATFTVDEVFGNWKQAQKTHFDDGGTYDQILAATHRQ